MGGWTNPSDNVVPAAAVPAAQPVIPTAPAAAAPAKEAIKIEDEEERHHLTLIHDRLHRTFNADCAAEESPEESNPAAPSVWVVDYADFSQKYGLSYRLNTGHTGVHYNDSTKMIWEPITNHVEYYARIKETVDGIVRATDTKNPFHMESAPESLNKKVTLIKYFKSYLTKAKGKREGGRGRHLQPVRQRSARPPHAPEHGLGHDLRETLAVDEASDDLPAVQQDHPSVLL